MGDLGFDYSSALENAKAAVAKGMRPRVTVSVGDSAKKAVDESAERTVVEEAKKQESPSVRRGGSSGGGSSQQGKASSKTSAKEAKEESPLPEEKRVAHPAPAGPADEKPKGTEVTDEVYRDSKTLSPDMTEHGGESVQEPKAKPKIVHVKNLPRNIVNAINETIPQTQGMSYSDTIATFVYVYAQRRPKVSERVKEAADDFIDGEVDDGDVDAYERWTKDVTDALIKVNEKLDSVANKLKTHDRYLSELLLSDAFMVYDKLGFERMPTPDSPAQTDFLQPGVEDLSIRREGQAKLYLKKRRQRDGRPQSKERRENDFSDDAAVVD